MDDQVTNMQDKIFEIEINRVVLDLEEEAEVIDIRDKIVEKHINDTLAPMLEQLVPMIDPVDAANQVDALLDPEGKLPELVTELSNLRIADLVKDMFLTPLLEPEEHEYSALMNYSPAMRGEGEEAWLVFVRSDLLTDFDKGRIACMGERLAQHADDLVEYVRQGAANG